MTRNADAFRRIWASRVIDVTRELTVDRPLLVGSLTLGLVPVGLTLLFVALTAEALPHDFLVAHVLATAVPFLGPAAIWYWDARVFPRFVEETADLVTDSDAVHGLGARYKRIFASRWHTFAVPWTALVVCLIALNVEYFRTLGLSGVSDPAYVVYLLFAAWWGLVTGIGFHGAITATRAIRAVGQLELQVDPLHPDGLGGLSSVGNLAIWTTMLISLGSLTLPLAFLLGNDGGYAVLVYLAVGVYVAVIAVSFLYPTVYVNRRAQEIQEAELERRRAAIRRLQSQSTDLARADGDAGETATIDEVAKRLEIQRLRDEFDEYAAVSLYPLSVGIIVRLASSILLPIAFTVFEMYLGRLL